MQRDSQKLRLRFVERRGDRGQAGITHRSSPLEACTAGVTRRIGVHHASLPQFAKPAHALRTQARTAQRVMSFAA